MEIGKVIGTIVSTVKHPAYHGKKLLVVQLMHQPDQPEPASLIAIDQTHAGIGDTVLVLREGNGVRQVTGIKDAPINSAIIGILDSIELH